jgi:hypothetical protein
MLCFFKLRDRPEHKLIEDIVKDILRKLQLNCSFLSDYQGMIGIDKHIEQIQSLLHIDSEEVRIVGIWGMGNISKTGNSIQFQQHHLKCPTRNGEIWTTPYTTQIHIRACRGKQHIVWIKSFSRCS